MRLLRLEPEGNLFPAPALAESKIAVKLQNSHNHQRHKQVSGREELIAVDDDWNKIVLM